MALTRFRPAAAYSACLLALAACVQPHASAAVATQSPRPAAGDSPGNAAGAANVDDLARRVTAVADDYLAVWRATFPELDTWFGMPNGRHDRLSRNDAAAEQAWWRQEDRLLAALHQLDPTPLAGRPEWVTYGVLRDALESGVGMRVCQERVWTVHPLRGLLADYAALAEQQPVGSDDLRAQALARWRTFPHFIDVEIENLREGVRRGYTEPRVNVERVIGAADRLLSGGTAQSPFYSPASRDSAPAFRQAFGALVADEITPAVRRYRDYLATEYRPAARTAIAITANPDGGACYRAAIRAYTTVDISPAEVHRLGLELVATAESSLRTLAERRYGTTDVREAMRRVRADSSATFHSREAVVPALEAILSRVTAGTSQQFGIRPKAALTVRPFPAFQESSVPLAEYLPPAEDGSRPGTFRVNLRYATAPGERLRMDGLTFHEGVPGHHFQLSIAVERTGAGVHPLTRYLGNSAFGEGWAIYAEHLADELGLFSSNASRMRWLEDKVYDGATLVMETGMHDEGWSRQQAIDYELAHTTRSPEQAAIDVDRRIGWPGQGLSYQVGYLEIRRLRTQAEQTLGPRFDPRAFHDHVLENGSITLSMLRERITRWLAEVETSP